MLKRLDRILIRVPQLASAVTYYRDVLGLELINQDRHFAALKFPGDPTEIMLHADATLPELGVYFLVDDVQAMYDARVATKLEFVSPPSKTARGFTATVRDPFGTVLQLLDRTAEHSASFEDAVPSGASLFSGVEVPIEPKRELLMKLYEEVGRTADDLPYTPHFERIFDAYHAAQHPPRPSRAEVWRHLLNLRKAGKLPRLGEARSKPPTLDLAQRHALRELLNQDLGKRDRLPYTKRFDEIVDGFNKTLPRPISPHLVWRAVATLAK